MAVEVATDVLNASDVPLWLITAQAGDDRGGLIATFVQNASLVPAMPRIVAGLARHHHTTQLIQATQRFGLHTLAERNADLVWRFGMTTGHDGDKFAALDYRLQDDAPLLRATPVAMTCSVEATLNAGDRLLFLAAVTAAHRQSDDTPLTRNRMIQLATPEQLAEMRRQREHDSEIDRQAILAWRADHE